MQSFKSFLLTEAGKNYERQENGLVRLIRRTYNKNGKKPFTLVDKDGKRLRNIVDAKKFDDKVTTGHEPYTDVQLITSTGRKINLSNKGLTAPSVAGGGIEGLELIVPDVTKNLCAAARKWYKKNGFKTGDYGADLFAKVNDDDKEKIIVGTKKMGGPIHYMYVGPMDVKSLGWDPKKQELKVNGNLIASKSYAETYDIHYRIRRRKAHQRLDLEAKDRRGYYSLLVTPEDIEIEDKKTGKMVYNEKKYGSEGKAEWNKKGRKREMNRRLVVSKNPPKNANIVVF